MSDLSLFFRITKNESPYFSGQGKKKGFPFSESPGFSRPSQ
jgi:hypothetical protein